MATLRSAGRPLSPHEVLTEARASVAALGLATVYLYRNLKLLVANGALRTISLPGDRPRCKMAEAFQQHHFQCTGCRRVYDVAGCPGDLRRLAPRGFTVEH